MWRPKKQRHIGHRLQCSTGKTKSPAAHTQRRAPAEENGKRKFCKRAITDRRFVAINLNIDMKLPELPPFDHKPKKYSGPSADEVLHLRKEFLNPGIFLYYKKPIMLVEGKMQYLWDEHGRRYLDALGGIVTISVGHCHPDVVDVVRQQNETLQHSTTIYLHPNTAEYAQKLSTKMPGDLKVCYFVNSGSEANDLALLMARAYTGNYDVIALRNAYHGGSTLTMGTTGNRAWKFNVPHSFGVHHAITPDPYRGLWGRDDVDAGKKYAADLKNLIDFATPGQVAAFIAESIQHLRRKSGCLRTRQRGSRCDRSRKTSGELAQDWKPNSRRPQQAERKTQHHRRRARQRITSRDRAGERSTIEGAGEGRVRASNGDLQRNGPASR